MRRTCFIPYSLINLLEPDELVLEIIDNLESGLSSFKEIAARLKL